MKITGVRFKPFVIRMSRPLGDANGPRGRTHMAGQVVFLDTDEGLTGVSLGGPTTIMQQLVDNVLVGHDPRGVRGLWKKMVDAVFKGGNRGEAGAALSALDVALWDLKAKANDEPLWKTLGASTRKVKAYASGIDYPLSNDELRAFYEGMAAKGISAGKLKVGLDIEYDLERIGIMRDALAKSGKRPELMIDSNEYWSPKQAIRYISIFERHYDLTWVEEPARRWDYRGLRAVSKAVKAAVATGENLDEIGDFMALIANEAVDVIEVGIGASGFTGMMTIADMAYGFEIPVALMNCPANYSAHVAAALPNHWMMEWLDAGRDALMIHNHRVEDGWIVLSDDPGLGISFDMEKLEAAGRTQLPAGEGFGWGRRRGAGLYLVGPNEPEEIDEE
ncbi:MAG: mandelate racemase/muconate lactonizing enzyme family protein [Chloroflexi bacterium]|nr:mandelate racemase/muconate lactonizing enzyme family protein [Chloroflexota bacterium]